MKAYTYILKCANGQYYVGSTTNIELRLKEHNEGIGGHFTKAHLPVILVYQETFCRIDEAFQRERQIHGWSRAKKEALINGNLSQLPFLSQSKTSL